MGFAAKLKPAHGKPRDKKIILKISKELKIFENGLTFIYRK